MFPISALKTISERLRANRNSAARCEKDSLTLQIRAMDALADFDGLDSIGWANRYALEANLTAITKAAEI